MQIFEEKLIQLKTLEKSLEILIGQKDALRKEILTIIEKEKIEQFKNDVATISRVKKSTIKYEKPVEEIIKHLKENKLVKYFTVVPKQIIEEHEEINKQFEEDVKEGVFTLEGINVVSSVTPMIRFK